jgi:hypothetical protein
MKTSELLRRAANEHLWEGEGVYQFYTEKKQFSCDSVNQAYRTATRNKWATTPSHVKAFLKELGVNLNGFHEFDEFPHGPACQGARYAWLMFAADIADEWGVE